jgi:hypothetical protein
MAQEGGEVVITDSNRRRAFVASRTRQSVGATLAAGEDLSEDGALLDPFDRGSDAQTVAVYRGARHVRAPSSPQIAQFPEQRPFAAFDRDPATHWLTDPTLEGDRHWVEIRLPERRDVDRVDVLPHPDPRATVTEVEVGDREFRINPGWNRLEVGLRDVDRVRVLITDQRTTGDDAGSAGGFAEIRIPGVRVRELLRPPVLAERALARRDLNRTGLTYLLSRTTADEPFRRSPAPPPPPLRGDRAEAEAALVRGAQDAETGLSRVISPPAARSWAADAWVTVAPEAPDPTLDRLTGTRARGARFASSGRFEGRPGFRASSAFDGDPTRPWVAPWFEGRQAWIEWTTPVQRTLRRLALQPGPTRARRPARVRLVVDGAAGPPLSVERGGEVVPPRAVRGRSFRLEVLGVRPGGTAPAIAIGELRGPGVPRARVPREGRLRSGCFIRLPSGAPAGDSPVVAGTVGGRRVALVPSGGIGGLDAGRPLRARQCGGPVALPAGEQEVHVPPGLFRVHTLRLRSAAPAPAPLARGGGRVLDPGETGRGEHDGVKVDVDGPSWLVLAESYNRGWRASCDGRDLGEPEVLDGFANAWRVDRPCRDVEFAFAPQRLVNVGYGLGALACLVLLGVLLLRRPRRIPHAPPEPIAVDDRSRRLPLRRAAVAGLAVGAVLGFVFALRAGLVIAPAVALILWRGLTPRQLLLAAGALLVIVVPLLYLLFPAEDRGGYNTDYAVEHLGAHWVAVGAVVLLILALSSTLAGAIRPAAERRRQSSSTPTAARTTSDTSAA